MAKTELHEPQAPEGTDRRIPLHRAQKTVGKADSHGFEQRDERVHPDWDVSLAGRLPMRRSRPSVKSGKSKRWFEGTPRAEREVTTSCRFSAGISQRTRGSDAPSTARVTSGSPSQLLRSSWIAACSVVCVTGGRPKRSLIALAARANRSKRFRPCPSTKTHPFSADSWAINIVLPPPIGAVTTMRPHSFKASIKPLSTSGRRRRCMELGTRESSTSSGFGASCKTTA